MRILTFLTCFFSVLWCSAQQLPQFSGFQMNKVVINPAVTGSNPWADFRLHHRTQWAGFDNNPSTSLLSMHSSINKKNFGVGLNAFSDQSGILQTTGVSVGYGYHLPLGASASSGKLSFGLNGVYSQHSLNADDIVVVHADDALLQSGTSTFGAFEAGFGMLLHNSKSYFGVSALNLLGQDVSYYDNGIQTNEMHLYFMGGYDFEVGEKGLLQTAFLGNYVNGNPFQADIRVGYEYDQLLQFSAGYRSGDALIFGAGVFVLPNLGVHYYYDMTLSPIKTASSGSHEVMLSYMWFYNPKYKKSRKRYNLNLAKPQVD